MHCSLKTVAIAGGVIIASATTPLATAASGSSEFKATSQLATFSATHGYPAVGGSAILSGPLYQHPGGQGAQVDHITTTGHPASNVFTSRATDVHYLARGSLRFTFRSTDTLEADGTLKIVGSALSLAATHTSSGFAWRTRRPPAAALAIAGQFLGVGRRPVAARGADDHW